MVWRLDLSLLAVGSSCRFRSLLKESMLVVVEGGWLDGLVVEFKGLF